MNAALLVFPGSNCDRDARVALTRACGHPPRDIWHTECSIPNDIDFILVPGGFTHGDYLRPGAMAARAPVTRALVAHAARGTAILGICNGFQILTECGLLPGALIRNTGIKFVARDVHLKVERTDTMFTRAYRESAIIRMPVAHMDGNYFADNRTLSKLNDDGRIAFRYTSDPHAADWVTSAILANPNGSIDDIAGIYNEQMNVLGLMPHPERACERITGSTDGAHLFTSLIEHLS
jgi:phosphoribosylformylglycinamidine synthase I